MARAKTSASSQSSATSEGERPRRRVCVAHHSLVRKPAEIDGSSGAGQTTASMGKLRRGEPAGSPTRTEESRIDDKVCRLAAGTGGSRILARTIRRWRSRSRTESVTASCRARRTDRYLRHDHQESPQGWKSEGKGRQESGISLHHSYFTHYPSPPMAAHRPKSLGTARSASPSSRPTLWTMRCALVHPSKVKSKCIS